jgi:uncharacterized protein YfbU (UPF0304 family)
MGALEDSELRFVEQVLTLHQALEMAFPGFDPQDSLERTYLSAADALIADGRFPGLQIGAGGRALRPMLSSYRAMIAAWDRLGRPLPLCAEMAAEIHAAAWRQAE